jgi:hypothetical protein
VDSLIPNRVAGSRFLDHHEGVGDVEVEAGRQRHLLISQRADEGAKVDLRELSAHDEVAGGLIVQVQRQRLADRDRAQYLPGGLLTGRLRRRHDDILDGDAGGSERDGPRRIGRDERVDGKRTVFSRIELKAIHGQVGHVGWRQAKALRERAELDVERAGRSRRGIDLGKIHLDVERHAGEVDMTTQRQRNLALRSEGVGRVEVRDQAVEFEFWQDLRRQFGKADRRADREWLP